MNKLDVLRRCLVFAKKSNFKGYSKYDAFNSPILKSLQTSNKWIRLVWSQLVMRFPFNIRPLLLVKKERNPKGIALFARSYLNLYSLTRDEKYLGQAKNLLSWLEHNYSRGFSGMCWGYNYDWQDIGFFAPKFMPNCIVSCFVLDAFVLAYEMTDDPHYLKVLESGANFLLHDLKTLFESDNMLCKSYAPVDMDMIVMDTSAWAGSILSKLFSFTDNLKYKQDAFRLINFVVDKQTPYGAWFYSHPPKDSHITHDNYHTGYILDCILDYTKYTDDRQFIFKYLKGLDFYYKHLFLRNGTPKFMNNQKFPFDIHGAAQGIITFSRAKKFNPKYGLFANKIYKWAVDNMLDKKFYFYYQKRRFYTRKYLLLRWNQAWMCNAISVLLKNG